MSRLPLPYGRPTRTLGWIVALALIVPLALFTFQCSAPDGGRAPPPPGPAVAPRPGAVSGAVRFADGTPAAGAIVTVLAGEDGAASGAAHAGADGTFVVPGIAPGTARIEVEARLGPLRASLDRGGLEGDLVNGVVARIGLPATFTLSGVVLDAGERTPVAAAVVTCVGRRAASRADGGFFLRGLPAAAARELPLVLEAEAEGYAPSRDRLPADWLPGRYSDVQVLLERAR